MNKLEYLAALKNALHGLAPEIITDMLNAYEMRFIEGANLGRSEQEIILNLDTPQAVAARLRANLEASHRAQDATQQPQHPQSTHTHTQYTPPLKKDANTSLIGKIFAVIGLGIFNLFMLIPVTVFCAMLFASFVSSLAFVVSGSAFTAASLAHVNQITLNDPNSGNAGKHTPSVVKITKDGIQVDDAKADDGDDADEHHFKWVHFGKQLEPSTPVGLGLILGGILLFLLNLVITKYSFLGIKRYLMMNYSIIKNA